MIKNPKQLLVQATKLPAAIETKLPEGAPKLSVTLVDAANKMPALPDFPVEVPDLPDIPKLPTLPELPAGLRRQIVTDVTVPTPAQTVQQRIIPSPTVGVLPEVVTRRGM